MATPTKVKGILDFRAAHDKDFIVPQKIKVALVALGKDGWEYEAQFYKAAGISTTDGARYRDEFKEQIVTIEAGKKRIYCGSPALAVKMKAMVV